jgi:hypothetical protein
VSLINLALCKTFANIPSADTRFDVQLTQLANYIDGDVKSYLERDIEQVNYPGAAVNSMGDSGFYSGDKSPFIKCRQYPVLPTGLIIAVDYEGYAGQNPNGTRYTKILTQGVDYFLKLDGCIPGTSIACSYCGIIQRINQSWWGNTFFSYGVINPVPVQFGGVQNIKVSYTAGYPTTPPAIGAAAALMVSLLRAKALRGDPKSGEGLGAYSYSLRGPVMGAPPELTSARQMLQKFKRPIVGSTA